MLNEKENNESKQWFLCKGWWHYWMKLICICEWNLGTVCKFCFVWHLVHFYFRWRKMGSSFHMGSWEQNPGSSEMNKYFRITFIYLCAYTQTQMSVVVGFGNYFCTWSFKYFICEQKSSLEPSSWVVLFFVRFFVVLFWAFFFFNWWAIAHNCLAEPKYSCLLFLYFISDLSQSAEP